MTSNAPSTRSNWIRVRKVLRLRYCEGLSRKEVGERCKLSERQVERYPGERSRFLGWFHKERDFR